jgi:hypothetical protein
MNWAVCDPLVSQMQRGRLEKAYFNANARTLSHSQAAKNFVVGLLLCLSVHTWQNNFNAIFRILIARRF